MLEELVDSSLPPGIPCVVILPSADPGPTFSCLANSIESTAERVRYEFPSVQQGIKHEVDMLDQSFVSLLNKSGSNETFFFIKMACKSYILTVLNNITMYFVLLSKAVTNTLI